MNMITDLVRKFGAILLIMMLLIPSAAADVVTAEWNRQPQNAVPTDSAISQYGDVAVVSYDNGYVVAIDTAGNTEIWSTDIGSSVTEIVLNPEATYVLAYDSANKVTLLKVDTGAVVWTYQSPSAVLDIDMSLSQKCMIVTGTEIMVKDVAGSVYMTISNNKNNLATAQPTFLKAVIDADSGYIVAGMSDNTVKKYKINTYTSSTWHLTDYIHRREHRVVGSSEGPLPNYGINVTVYRTNGVTTGDKIYVGSKVQTDFDDVRFVSKSTGQTLQHAKVGSVTNGMKFSVKIPNLGKSQNYDFYVYYGNPSATDASNSAGISYGNDILSVATGNWMMETSDGWVKTTYTDTTSPYSDGWRVAPSSTITLPSTAWKTQGSSSMYLYVRDGISYEDILNRFDQKSHNSYAYATQQFPGFSGTNSAFKADMVYDIKMNVAPSRYPGDGGDTYGYSELSATSETKITSSNGISTTHSYTYLPGGPSYEYVGVGVVSNIASGNTITIRVDCGSDVHTGNYGSAGTNSWALTMPVTTYIDNIRFQRHVTYPPTHSTWGVETDYPVDGYLQDTETLTDAIKLMDLAWDGNKVSVATDTRLYSLTIDANGIASATYAATTGTPYDLMSGSDNNYVVEGRGLKALIYQSGTTLIGSQTAGNNMKHVALDEITGTWAVGAADDTHVYVFSKSNTSTWAYVWGTTPPELVRTVAMNARGQNFLYAINSGYIYFYSTTATSVTYPDVFITIHISKNGAPYAGALCDVYYSDTGSGYALENAGMIADSSGKLVVHAITGDYYRIVVKDPDGNIEDSLDIHVGRTTYDYYLSVITYAQPGDTPSFGATYDDTTEQITVRYNDPGLMTTGARIVIAKIDEVTGTKTVVMDRSEFDNPNSIVAAYTVDDPGVSYYIEMHGERGVNDYHNTRVITASDRWSIADDLPGIYYLNALITWIFIGGLAYAGSRRSIGVTLVMVIAVVAIAGQFGLIATTMESVSFAILLTAASYILSRAKGGN
jgi:hypothetical protein